MINLLPGLGVTEEKRLVPQSLIKVWIPINV